MNGALCTVLSILVFMLSSSIRGAYHTISKSGKRWYNVLSVMTPSRCDLRFTPGCHVVAMWIPHSNKFKIRAPHGRYVARTMEYWFGIVIQQTPLNVDYNTLNIFSLYDNWM